MEMLRCLAAAGALAGVCGFCTAQAITFASSKAGNYLQVTDGVVTAYNDFNGVLSIAGSEMDSFAACEITYAGPLSPLAMGIVGNDAMSGQVWYGYSNLNPSIAALDAEFPAGDYLFTYTGNALPSGSHVFTMRPSTFCPEIPELTGDTFSRLATYKSDLSVDFVGTMGGFTDEPGANNSSLNFVIYDVGKGGAFYTNQVTPTSTSFTIPGNAIEAGRAYYGVMSYLISFKDEDAGVAGGLHVNTFSRNLYFYFNTRGPCPADLNGDSFVDDSDFVLFVQAYDLLYCTDPASPDKCPADLTNDGIVVDDDFVAFVPAYDQLLCEPE